MDGFEWELGDRALVIALLSTFNYGGIADKYIISAHRSLIPLSLKEKQTNLMARERVLEPLYSISLPSKV